MKTAEDVIKNRMVWVSASVNDRFNIIEAMEEYAKGYMPKWISVEDELPKDISKVRTYSKFTKRQKDAWYNDFYKKWYSNTKQVSRITHWMPFPKNPAE